MTGAAVMPLESALRRATWKQNATVFAVGVVVVAFGILFLFVYGDPAGRAADGHLDVHLSWRTDGALAATIRTPFSSEADNERVAAAVLPAFLGDPTRLAVSYPADKGGTHSISARTLMQVAPPEDPLNVSTTDLVQAARQVGMTSVDVSLELPNVPSDVRSSAPAIEYGNTYEWTNIQDLDGLEISATLQPSNRSWFLQTAVLAAIAAVAFGVAVVTGRRALDGRLSERRARFRYAIGMVLSAAALLWSLRVGWLVDDPDIIWHLDGLPRFAAHWGAALLWLFVGAWITFALLASSVRDGVRRRYPPPPPSPPRLPPSAPGLV